MTCPDYSPKSWTFSQKFALKPNFQRTGRLARRKRETRSPRTICSFPGNPGMRAGAPGSPTHPPTSPAQERTKVHAGAPRPTPEDDAPGSAKAQRPTEPATPAALPGPGPGPAWAPLASTKRRPRTCQRIRPLPTPRLRTPGSLARGVRLQALPVLGASGLGLSGSGADLGRKSVGRRLRPAPAVSSHALPASRRLLKRVWQGLGGRWARFLFLHQRQG